MRPYEILRAETFRQKQRYEPEPRDGITIVPRADAFAGAGQDLAQLFPWRCRYHRSRPKSKRA